MRTSTTGRSQPTIPALHPSTRHHADLFPTICLLYLLLFLLCCNSRSFPFPQTLIPCISTLYPTVPTVQCSAVQYIVFRIVEQANAPPLSIPIFNCAALPFHHPVFSSSTSTSINHTFSHQITYFSPWQAIAKVFKGAFLPFLICLVRILYSIIFLIIPLLFPVIQCILHNLIFSPSVVVLDSHHSLFLFILLQLSNYFFLIHHSIPDLLCLALVSFIIIL